MLTWLLYIVALIIIVALLTWGFGKVLGRGEIMPELVDHESLLKLNEAALGRGDFDALTFDTVLRGYRQDQVDPVIGALIAENQRLRQGAGQAVPIGGVADADKQQLRDAASNS
ncbi:hypothetical protein [Corynebacterium epidermidicanis]|uniref:DivIVA domain n=1 Tax=Corynebacterium epidermidicanis TaxID=1050174 RepID=A0A0G3GNU4_9CORY|nr:hypothetical protein [Corynebacterium epidermidicanis]AKK02819.1 hypothetical protein CEPID_04745 [Corynebacterium epidermidicanis]